MKSDVITAISTPVGIGGIAVIRVSGESAIELVSKIFQGKRDIKRVKTHTVHYGYIKDPKTNQIIDEVLVTVMRQPYSYTGEDMVEINCHGGRVVPYNVLEIVIKAGARIAEPGEFTKRAFINGRLDLVQAQAILELINARSKEGVLLAQGRLQGELSRRLKTLREKLVELLKEIEVRIDFPDEVEEFEEKTLKEALGGVLDEMGGLLSRGRRGRYYLNGATLPIVGRVNVGKSTLFNRLLDEERAIVTEIPGTTRDIISDEIIIEGLPVKLLDTAGYRKTENRLEIIGIEKTQEKLTKVDGVIFLIDASNPLDEEDITLWRELPQRKLVVLTKIDLGNIVDLSPLGKISKECLYSVSGLKGWGIEELKRGIKDFLLGEMTDTEFSISHREEGLLLSAREEIKKVFEEKSIPIDILSMRIYEVVRTLDRMTGGGNVEDEVIDRIFSDFCVGK